MANQVREKIFYDFNKINLAFKNERDDGRHAIGKLRYAGSANDEVPVLRCSLLFVRRQETRRPLLTGSPPAERAGRRLQSRLQDYFN